jgi:hypothetical protein
MRKPVAIAACTALMLALATPAIADDAQKAAKKHFTTGVKLYKSDDFTGALAEFLKAYELKPHYAVLYNIASCQKNLEYYAEALVNFELYLDEGGDEIKAKRRAEVEEDIDTIIDLLSQVTLTCNVAGATITINGKEYGNTPHMGPLFVDAGEHVISVSRDGYADWEKDIILSRGEKASFDVYLEPLATDPVSPEPVEGEPEPEPDVEPDHPELAPSSVEGPVEGEPEPAKKKLGPAAFYAVMAVTIGALGLSAATGAAVLKRRNDFYDMDFNDRNLDSHMKITKGLALATDVLWGVAGAGVITMIILGVKTNFKKEKEEHSFLLAPTVGPDGAGLVLEVKL